MSATTTRSTGALFRRFRRTGDAHAGETLVRRFLPLARNLARRYHGGTEQFEDLVQVASVGLIKAVQRYDDRRGVSFSTYAVPTITGELKRHFRDNAWAVHVPRGLRERAVQVNSGVKSLSEKNGGTPSTPELAAHLKLDEQEVLDAQAAYTAYDAVSLDAPRSQDDREQQVRSDAVGSTDDGYELTEDRIAVNDALQTLPPQERRVLHMRFVEDRTQSDIASRIGVSQMQVSRILRRTVERLRRTIERPVESDHS